MALGRFETLSAAVGFTAHPAPFGLHPIRTGQAQPKLIGWCMTTHEVGVLLPRLLFGPSPPTTMPSADFCRSLTLDYSRVSLSSRQVADLPSKPNPFSRPTAGLPTSALDGCGLRYTVPTRPTPYASIRFLFIGSRFCFHASFRRLLAESPLRFAITSPPSGCERDFHPLAVRHARHTRLRFSRVRLRTSVAALLGVISRRRKRSCVPFRLTLITEDDRKTRDSRRRP